jgi:hypothetical protein
MPSALYRSFLALAMLALAAIGSEVLRSADWDGEAWAAETVGSAETLMGGGYGMARRELQLSDEERAQVFDGVMRTAGVPTAEVAAPEGAAPLPGWVALQELPAGVARELPRVEGYKFVKLDDRILLVNPASRQVVAEMPRYKLVLQ